MNTVPKKDGILWVTSNLGEDEPTLRQAASESDLEMHFAEPESVLQVLRAHKCTVVGLDLGSAPDEGIKRLRDLHEKMPGLTLLAASSDANVNLIRAALEAGAADFLGLPLNGAELHKTLIKTTHRRLQTLPGIAAGEVITVYGVRGGLGTTTLSVNLAVRIAALTGANTGLMDLDLQRGDVATFLNLAATQTLSAFAASTGETDAMFLHHTLVRHAAGVYVLPAPAQIEEAEMIGREHVEQALSLLRKRFAHTVVDTARMLTDTALSAFEQSEHLLVLTDLSVPGVRAARRVLDLLSRLETSATQIHLIFTGGGKEAVKLEEAERALGRQPLMILPRDEEAAVHAMNAGTVLNGSKPSPLTLAVTELARKLTGTPEESGRSGWRRIFGRKGATT